MRRRRPRRQAQSEVCVKIGESDIGRGATMSLSPGSLLTGVLILAVLVQGYKTFRRRRRPRGIGDGLGLDRSRPFVVGTFLQMEALLSRLRCACSGSLVSLGETTVWHHEMELRAVRLECLRCEESGSAYFQVSEHIH